MGNGVVGWLVVKWLAGVTPQIDFRKCTLCALVTNMNRSGRTGCELRTGITRSAKPGIQITKQRIVGL